jgi:hypothetical protein
MARRAALALWCALSAACGVAINPDTVADAQTAVRVKTALVNDPDLGEHAIEVAVVGGIVTLSGRVATPQQADQALRLSRAVAGVSDVRSELQVSDAPANTAPEGTSPREPRSIEPEAGLRRTPLLLAAGGAVSWSNPRAGVLFSDWAFSPIVKLGWGRGFGPAFAFDWFRADVLASGARPQTLSRVHVKPIMAGVGYTMTSDRISLSSSIVGGLAFNSVTITDTGAAAGVPVEVDNSLAWRPGVSAWFDTGRRVAINVSTGYVMTNLRMTILEDGRLVKRDARGDTALVQVGVAYRVF